MIEREKKRQKVILFLKGTFFFYIYVQCNLKKPTFNKPKQKHNKQIKNLN